jgi:DNA-binding phage protein
VPRGNPFFDPDDLLQARYEMVRGHRVDRVGVSEVAESYGVSRPTFYKSQSALDAGGLSALLPALAVAIRRVEAIAMTPNAP